MKYFRKMAAVMLLLGLAVSLFGCGGRPLNKKAIATVTTGKNKTVVTTVGELTNAVDPSGNSVVTLWNDVTSKTPIRIPYSCTIDMNGYCITTNLQQGNGIEVAEAGTENPVTTLKNGKVSHFGYGILARKGAVVVDNMILEGRSGVPVGIGDTNEAYRAINAICNSTISSGSFSCVAFTEVDGDYSATGITITNSNLISHNPDGTMVFTAASGATAGTIDLGEHVNIYSYGKTLAVEGFFYSGMMAPKSAQTVSVTVGENTVDGLTCWSTDNEDNAINLLMIGNSFCYYFVQELYGVADAAGVQINVTNLYEAGCYVQEHWDWLNNESLGAGKYQYWITNSMGRWKHGQIRESYNALEYMQWDVITLQQHFGSGVSNYDKALAKCTPYTKDLFTYLKTNYPEADLYWHETWAYQVGHENMPSASEQAARQDRIIAVSDALAKESGVPIIPAGQAWKIARANPQIGDVLCRLDLYHDGDVGGGQYLNACVWFEVLTGKSCIGNTWRPDNYQLEEAKILQLQQAAHAAVAAVYGADYAK